MYLIEEFISKIKISHNYTAKKTKKQKQQQKNLFPKKTYKYD